MPVRARRFLGSVVLEKLASQKLNGHQSHLSLLNSKNEIHRPQREI